MIESDDKLKSKGKTPRRIVRWGKIVIIAYCAIGIALYYLQEKLMFHPEPLAHDYVFSFDVPFKEVNIPINKTDMLNMVQFYPVDKNRKGVVLYFHGNRGNINRYAKYAVNFTKNGYEVWIADYPGYGKTTGKLSEQNLYMQAREVYKLANSRYAKDSIILYGKSLGSGIASYLAAKKNCKRLILETPYYSMMSLLQHYAPVYPTGGMSKFKFPTFKYLEETRAPITIFHGNDDNVIPYSNAHRLTKYLKPKDEFIPIENGSHNNLNEFPQFHEKLDSILNSETF